MAGPLRLVASGGVDIHPVGCALTPEIRRAGRMMEQAMAAGQRELAVVWMNTMYGLIRVRAGASGGPAVGVDIQPGGRDA